MRGFIHFLMGKVKKILLRCTLYTLGVAIILPLIVAGVLCIPSVQTFVVGKASSIASRKMETKIEIKSIYLKPFSKIEVGGIYVEDYQNDTLLYAKSLTADIRNLGIFSKRYSIGLLELNQVNFFLSEDSTGVLNIKKILDRIKRTNPKTATFYVDAYGVKISDLNFKFRKYSVDKRMGTNFKDISIRNFNMSASNIFIVNDSIRAGLDHLSFEDKGGFELVKLTSQLAVASNTGVRLDQLRMVSEQSDINLPKMYMLYESWSAFKNFVSEVKFDVEGENSSLSFKTISHFAPALREWKSHLNNLSFTMTGPIDDLKGKILSATMRNTEINASYSIHKISKIDQALIDIKFTKLKTNAHDIDFVVRDITGKSFGKNPEHLKNLGDIYLTGNFKGLIKNFNAKATINTLLGSANINLAISNAQRNTRINGIVDMNRFNIGKLLNINNLGNISFKTKVDGVVGKSISLNTDSQISEAIINGFPYENISMNGIFTDKTFSGNIHSKGKYLNFDFNGQLNFNDSIPRYNFDLDLKNADLNRLGFNKRDSISTLRCHVKALASGRNVDELNGSIVIDNMTYINPKDTVSTGVITLRGENSSSSKLLTLSSSFADAEFRSRLSYKVVADYLSETLQEYFPTLTAKKHKAERIQVENATDITNYSIVKLNVKQANNVAGIFYPTLQLAQGTNMLLMFNPAAKQLSLSLKSDYIEQERFFVSNLDVNSHNQGDSLIVYMRSDEIFVGALRLPNLSILGGAKNNSFNLSARFADKERGTNALVGFNSHLTKSASGVPQISIALQPSGITTNNRTWRILSREIRLDTTRVTIDNFRIVSNNEVLKIDGTASRKRSDTVKISMRNFNIAPISHFTSSAGYDIEGYANGYVNIRSAMRDAIATSSISLDSLSMNGISSPALKFDSRWDMAHERARFTITNTDKADTVVVGHYRPSDQRFRVDADIKGLDMALLSPPLKSVLSKTKGYADAKVMLTGTTSKPIFSGEIKLRDFETTIDFLNTTYRLPEGSMSIENSLFTLKPTTLYDAENNKAGFDMSLNLGSFENILYNITIRPEKLLVMNTSAKDNDLFYGKVYASGEANIRGDRLGVKMNIAATTEENTSFSMPLGGKTDVSRADFVRFENPQSIATLSQLDLYKARKVKDNSKATINTNMDINLTVNANQNADFQLVIDPTIGDAIRCRGNGSINMQINPQRGVFTMSGDYEIAEGSYMFTLQDIINKRFTIQQGSSIQWAGNPLDANLNITALYKLKASLAALSGNSTESNLQRSVPVDCEIIMTGKLQQPTVAFDIKLPNADPDTRNLVANVINTPESKATQFFWLIAANTFYAEGGVSGSSQNMGALSTSAIGFEFLSSQLTSMISSEKLDFNLSYKPRSDINSDELGFGFSYDIIANKLQIEAEGNFDTGNNLNIKSNSASNITGDAAITWTINKSGRIKLRGFTRTIDSYNEDRGLQQTGLTLFFKEDFNRFSDVINKIKNVFLGNKKLKEEK